MLDKMYTGRWWVNHSMGQLIDLYIKKNPNVYHELRGSEPADIERLESIVGKRLPMDYREFLLRMGANPIPLQIMRQRIATENNGQPVVRTIERRIDFKLITVLRKNSLPRRGKKSNKSSVSRYGSLILIGYRPDVEDEGHFYLDVEREGEPPIISICNCGANHRDTIASSFKEYFATAAF